MLDSTARTRTQESPLNGVSICICGYLHSEGAAPDTPCIPYAPHPSAASCSSQSAAMRARTHARCTPRGIASKGGTCTNSDARLPQPDMACSERQKT